MKDAVCVCECAGCHSLIDLEKVSCRFCYLFMLLYFYAPFAGKAFSENCKGKSVVVVVGVAVGGTGGAGNDKLSTHFSFIFNTFDWYIEHLARLKLKQQSLVPTIAPALLLPASCDLPRKLASAGRHFHRMPRHAEVRWGDGRILFPPVKCCDKGEVVAPLSNAISPAKWLIV